VATHKDAVKRHKQNLRRRDRNKYYKSTMRSMTKKFRSAIDSGELEDAQQLLFGNVKLIQKIAQKGIIHQNQAARRVSRMYKALNKAKANA
jgi:small subunit ribosomal protein S20